jgi:hypothetical protein
MTLPEQLQDGLVTLANTPSGHDFVPQVVLDDLLSMELVVWRSLDEVGLTVAGERVYEELAEAMTRVF